MLVSVIVAAAENGVVGVDNSLPWHLPEDLKYFKRVTLGKPIIMGRKTFDSIGRALPGRLNIVLTANAEWQSKGVVVASSIDQALKLAQAEKTDKAFVIGGGQIYTLFLPYASTLEMTEVYDTPVADTFFPNFSGGQFKEVQRQSITDSTPKFDYVTYRKV